MDFNCCANRDGFHKSSHICYLLCQNPPFTPTMLNNIFHCQWIASSINYLHNCRYTTAKCWQVCFFWGLFLRPVRHLQVLMCPLNATSWLAQVTTLLEIITRLVDDIGHGFSYIYFGQFECQHLWIYYTYTQITHVHVSSKFVSTRVTHACVQPLVQHACTVSETHKYSITCNR